MLVQISAVLTAEEVQTIRSGLLGAAWADGRLTAGYRSAEVKANLQVPQVRPRGSGCQRYRHKGAGAKRQVHQRHPASPRVSPRSSTVMSRAWASCDHVDNAVRQIPGTPHRLRTDVSATLFLSAPQEYDGGELVINDLYGAHSVKLAAGDMVVYPASSLHRVEPVTRGARDAAFFWAQSMVRDDSARSLLYDMEMSISELTARGADARSLLRLTGCYHNLIRRWADL